MLRPKVVNKGLYSTNDELSRQESDTTACFTRLSKEALGQLETRNKLTLNQKVEQYLSNLDFTGTMHSSD